MITIKYIIVLLLLGSVFCRAEPMEVIRVGPESEGWLKERDAIIESYRKKLNPAEGTKVFPLFVSVSLSLGEPINEFGAHVYEAAYVYSEIPSKDGSKKREIVILFRSPYWADRGWDWEATAMKNSVEGKYLLEKNIDLVNQLAKIGEQVDSSAGPGLQKIKMVIFEKDIREVFGKDLDDATLRDMLLRREVEVKKPE